MKSGRFIGLMAALAAFILLFAWGFMNTPQYSLVLAANEDIPAGTYLTGIPVAMLSEVKLTADQAYSAMYLTQEQFQMLAAKGAFLTENIHKNEFLRTMAVAYAGNPEQARRAALGMTDPDMRDTILPFEYLPTGILPGDCVDLAVVTTDVRNLSGGSAMLPALLEDAAASGSGLPTGNAPDSKTIKQATGTSAPTITPTIPILLPLGKYIVQCALVVSVIREKERTYAAGGQAETGNGKAIALELIVPQESAEMVAMASQAGVLRVFLRPASADDKTRKPSIGASMQDVLDLFYADRERLAKTTPSRTPAATQTPIPADSSS
jgi:hypothetical protein